MKKYLLLMLLTPLAYSEANTYHLDSHSGGVRVICINELVFVTRDDGGVTQMMTAKGTGRGTVGLMPVTCEGYKETKEAILAKSNG